MHISLSTNSNIDIFSHFENHNCCRIYLDLFGTIFYSETDAGPLSNKTMGRYVSVIRIKIQILSFLRELFTRWLSLSLAFTALTPYVYFRVINVMQTFCHV